MFHKLLFLIALFLLSSISWAEVELKVAYDTDIQFPYYLGQSPEIPQDKPGSVVELVKLLETKVEGLKVSLKRYPWKRCLVKLKAGQVDSIFNSSFKEERQAFGRYPTRHGALDSRRRITTISYYFYKKKDSNFSWDGQQVSNPLAIIGAPLGFSIVDDLKRMNLEVVQTHATLSNLQKLMRGMISVVALQEVTADYYVKNFGQFKDLVKVIPPLKTKPYFLMISHQFSEKHPELSEKIWDAVAELRQEKLAKLTEKYFQ